MKSGNAKPLDEKQKQTTRQRNYHKPIGDLKYNFICFLLVTMIFFSICIYSFYPATPQKRLARNPHISQLYKNEATKFNTIFYFIL